MRLALIGDPVSHSRSPEIFARLFRDARIEGSYDLVRVRRGETVDALERLRESGYDGCNVTSPLKEEAAAGCDALSCVATSVEAVNAIAFGERTEGTNTDGDGALEAIRAIVGDLRRRSVVIVGTGPAARAAAFAITPEARVLLWGRDQSKVRTLCERLQLTAWDPTAEAADAALCAVPPAAELPSAVLNGLLAIPVVMDANYGERSTLGALLQRRVLDGALMLAAQARHSFAFWQRGRAL